MIASTPRRPNVSLALAVCGGVLAVLAVLDKLIGLVQHPLTLATASYVLLLAFLGWACFRGFSAHPHPRKLSIYGGLLLLNVLTAAYVLAWRVGADPTPVLLQAELARGDELLKRGDRDGAHLVYRDAYRRYPNSFAVLMRMGAVNYQVTDYERAARYYARALDLAPPRSRWRALNDLGQASWKLGRPEEAIDLYERAWDAGVPEREQTEWHYRMAYASFDAHDYDAAIEHYTAVAAVGGPYGAASYYNIACALAQKVRRAKDAETKRQLTDQAVDNLRRAWRTTTVPSDLQALRDGLAGPPDRRDPELQTLRLDPAFQALVREVKAS